ELAGGVGNELAHLVACGGQVLGVHLVGAAADADLAGAVVVDGGLDARPGGRSGGCAHGVSCLSERDSDLGHELFGVSGGAVDVHLGVEVRAGWPAGRADAADLLTSGDAIAGADEHAAGPHVLVAGHDAAAVVDVDRPAAVGVGVGVDH